MANAPVQDKRGFFVLPQKYEGGGYYVHGTPGQGQGQYSHPRMLTLLLSVANQWSVIDHRKFGVGNVSLADGALFKPHDSHRNGCRSMSAQCEKMGKNVHVDFMTRNTIVRRQQN